MGSVVTDTDTDTDTHHDQCGCLNYCMGKNRAGGGGMFSKFEVRESLLLAGLASSQGM